MALEEVPVAVSAVVALEVALVEVALVAAALQEGGSILMINILNGLYMKSSRFVCAIIRFMIKIAEKNQTFGLALNCYFLYTLLCVVFNLGLFYPI